MNEATKELPSFPTEGSRWTLTFGGVVFNGLFKGRDVAEGAQEQNHLLLFISNWGDLHEKPHGRP